MWLWLAVPNNIIVQVMLYFGSQMTTNRFGSILSNCYQFAACLILLLSLSLLSVIAIADDLVAARVADQFRPEITELKSGAKKIDIADPENGLSHNCFERYSVGKEGVVINNNRYAGKLEGYGQITANQRLKQAASTILFEVTGDTKSSLEGITAVVGSKAKFILSNPSGIECDGCGFINTTGVELRTQRLVGKGSSGELFWEEDASGEIRVGERGLLVKDGSLLLSSGKIVVKGLLDAKEVLRLEARGSETYAIDISGAAPISAGKIYLVATKEGSGVRISKPKKVFSELSDIPASGITAKSDLEISASKVMVTGGFEVGDKLTIAAREIAIEDSEISAGSLELKGDNLRLLNNKFLSNQAKLFGMESLESYQNHFKVKANLDLAGQVLKDSLSTYQANNFSLDFDNLKSIGSNYQAANDLTINAGYQLYQGSNLTVENLIKLTGDEIVLQGLRGAAEDYLGGNLWGKEIKLAGKIFRNWDGQLRSSELTQLQFLQELDNQGIIKGAEIKISSGTGCYDDDYDLGKILNRGIIEAARIAFLGSLLVNGENSKLRGEVIELSACKFINYGLIDTTQEEIRLGMDGYPYLVRKNNPSSELIVLSKDFENKESGVIKTDWLSLNTKKFTNRGELYYRSSETREPTVIANNILSGGFKFQLFENYGTIRGAIFKPESYSKTISPEEEYSLKLGGDLEFGVVDLISWYAGGFKSSDLNKEMIISGRLVGLESVALATNQLSIASSGEIIGSRVELTGAQVFNEGEVLALNFLKINAEQLSNQGTLEVGSQGDIVYHQLAAQETSNYLWEIPELILELDGSLTGSGKIKVWRTLEELTDLGSDGCTADALLSARGRVIINDVSIAGNAKLEVGELTTNELLINGPKIFFNKPVNLLGKARQLVAIAPKNQGEIVIGDLKTKKALELVSDDYVLLPKN